MEYPVCHLGAGNLFFSCMEYILLFLPVCYDYGISLSGMWAFKGGLFYSEGRVSAGMVPASVYLWNWFIDGSDLSFGRNVCVLYLQDDPLLSGRTANELLSGESSEPDCSGVSSAE